MDDFKKEIKRRSRFLKWMILLTIMSVFMMRFVIESGYFDIGSKIETALSFLLGMLAPILLVGVYIVMKYNRILTDEQQLKKMYIQEHDERKKLIQERMAKATLITGVSLLIVAIVVSACFEPIVSITLLCTLYALMFIGVGYKFYYSHKY